ncbi:MULTISPECIES: hypothetical protein [Paenibacillus]|uniref:hypothetical protein n=1 Tax=Paenibacillus TaxID=44249 RepID=UPI0016438B36|nr:MULTISPECIES: hypothetical protein [Paenibacillus]MBJ9989267.1 hypothetical protein [Paenibacillus sp. S28]
MQDADQTTNLKYTTRNNGQWSSDYLGKPGFYYGFDTLGKVYDWTIDKDGISTFGFQRAGNLSSDERKKTIWTVQNQAEWGTNTSFCSHNELPS